MRDKDGHPTAVELERDAAQLKKLIEDARELHEQITTHLRKLRRDQPRVTPATERRKKSL
jgi:hypothetical protein